MDPDHTKNQREIGQGACVMFSGGGTSGHINPSLAVARALRSRRPDLRIIYTGLAKGLEAELVPRAGFEFRAVEAAPFHFSKPAALMRAVVSLRKGRKQCLEWMDELHPAAVFATGGYVSAPLMSAAAVRNVPRVLHEQNAFPGRSNKWMSKGAELVCISFPGTEKYFTAARRVRMTGNPVRAEFVTAERSQARRVLGIPEEEKLVLATGGSLGARSINEAILSYFSACKKAGEAALAEAPHIILGCGSRLEPECQARAAELGLTGLEKLTIAGYLYDMVNYMAAADLIISRSGAGACAEIAALGKAAVFVPYPHAANDHQRHNAMAFQDCGAAVCLNDAQVDAIFNQDVLPRILSDRELRTRMETAARALAMPDAADEIAAELLTLPVQVPCG